MANTPILLKKGSQSILLSDLVGSNFVHYYIHLICREAKKKENGHVFLLSYQIASHVSDY